MEQSESLNMKMNRGHHRKQMEPTTASDVKEKRAESGALSLAPRPLAIKLPYVDDKSG